MSRCVRGAAVAVVLGVLVGGCSTAGEPVAQEPELFDACVEIPDEVIADMGFDPESASVGIAGVRQAEWEICSWTGDWNFVKVYSNAQSVDQMRARGKDVFLGAAPLAGRDAEFLRREGDTKEQECGVAFDTSRGLIQVDMFTKGSRDAQEPVCDAALRYAQRLDSYLPR